MRVILLIVYSYFNASVDPYKVYFIFLFLAYNFLICEIYRLTKIWLSMGKPCCIFIITITSLHVTFEGHIYLSENNLLIKFLFNSYAIRFEKLSYTFTVIRFLAMFSSGFKNLFGHPTYSLIE